MKLLVAEDEKRLASALKVILERNHYVVETVYDGEDALDFAMNGTYDCIVLDIMMPKKDGISVVQQLRSAGVTVPVLFLTAKGGLGDRIKGLDAGADDYLAKPFEAEELLARIRALLRRTSSYQPEILRLGKLQLNCVSCELEESGHSVRLNRKEFQVMEYLMRNPNWVYSSEQLLEQIWGAECETEMPVVWTNISSLRRKLETLGSRVCIRSIRGVGYCLEEKDSQSFHRMF